MSLLFFCSHGPVRPVCERAWERVFCVCACVQIYTNIHIHIYMYTACRSRAWAGSSFSAKVQWGLVVFVSACVRICVRLRVRVRISTYKNMFTHICMYIYVNICIYTLSSSQALIYSYSWTLRLRSPFVRVGLFYRPATKCLFLLLLQPKNTFFSLKTASVTKLKTSLSVFVGLFRIPITVSFSSSSSPSARSLSSDI